MQGHADRHPACRRDSAPTPAVTTRQHRPARRALVAGLLPDATAGLTDPQMLQALHERYQLIETRADAVLDRDLAEHAALGPRPADPSNRLRRLAGHRAAGRGLPGPVGHHHRRPARPGTGPVGVPRPAGRPPPRRRGPDRPPATPGHPAHRACRVGAADQRGPRPVTGPDRVSAGDHVCRPSHRRRLEWWIGAPGQGSGVLSGRSPSIHEPTDRRQSLIRVKRRVRDAAGGWAAPDGDRGVSPSGASRPTPRRGGPHQQSDAPRSD